VVSGYHAPRTRGQHTARIAGSGCLLALVFALSVIAAEAQVRPAVPGNSSSRAGQIAARAQHEITAGNVSGARNLLLEGVRVFPREASLWNLLGAAEAELQHPAKAKQDFRRAIALSPRYTGAYLNLGHLQEIESASNPKSLSGALDTFRKLLQFDPNNIDGLFQYALLAFQKGLFSDSLAHLRRIPEPEMQRARALAILCADLAATGSPDQAKLAADSMFHQPDVNEAVVLTAVNALAAHHHNSFAILLLKGLHQRGLASPDSLEELGLLEKSAGRIKEARSTLDEAARAKPNDVHLLMQLADVANQERDYRGALGYLAHARDLAPKNASIHFFFGMICVKLDLHEEAYESLKKAVALEPNNAYYNYALGAVCTARTDVDEAVASFKKYCSLKPHDPRGRLALGAAYYFAHNLSAAQSTLADLVRNPVTSTAANYYLGRVAADQGSYAAALAYLKQAIRERPEYADAYAALGTVYLREKNYSASSKAFQKALALQPENYLANLNLMILYLRTKDARAAAQQKRFAKVREERADRAKLFLRRIRVVR
jgi:tetratricopeptide (TPR) repeat protein